MTTDDPSNAQKVYSAQEPPQPPWDCLAPLWAEAERRGVEVKVVEAPSTAAERRGRSKRVHDLKGALRTLRFTVEALQEGYRFDDERAGSKIQAIGRAVRVLEQEVPVLTEVLRPAESPA